jgi:DNA mismatch endonuclease (patch repair protein)
MKARKKTAPMTRSENMSRIRSRNTAIEIILRKELWKRGLRYRVNFGKVFGRPDIVFPGKKVAVFCDSEFWHGRYFAEGKYAVKTNTDYWTPKLKRNIERDNEVNRVLKDGGWTVLRFWGEDIIKNVNPIADNIESVLNRS